MVFLNTRQWKQILAGLEQNPGRVDVVAGLLSICRTIQNPMEQGTALVTCAQIILPTQPLLAIKLLELALQLAPRNEIALIFAREIFKRRGRWASEQRVVELLATLTQTTATTVPPAGFAKSDALMRSDKTIERVVDSMKTVVPPTREVPSPTIKAEQSRVSEFLTRCGFQLEWERYSDGFSKTNAGLVAFVSLLNSLSLLSEAELPLAKSLLQKMIKEKDDGSGAQELYDRLFVHSLSKKGDA
ncbi:hypothetical protein EBU99_00725 [bacterium]|nr:hypothetical protein [bacterium]